jgi:hypothetical protein
MFINDIPENLLKQIDLKINENKISREDLEQIFSFILNTSKILYYFNNDKLYEIKSQKMNLYLFFVAFIKNYLSEINKYVNKLDLSDEYVSDIKNEVIIENKDIESFLLKTDSFQKININDLNKKDNDTILKKIKELSNIVEINQTNESSTNIINKLKENIHLLEEKESLIKKTIDETIEKRNKYLNYKKVLESRYKNDLTLFEHIKNLDENIDKEIQIIEESLSNIENIISQIIDVNQNLHDIVLTDSYPHF